MHDRTVVGGYVFNDPRLLEAALTHSSTRRNIDNQRLEFLGDAVLDLVTAEWLFQSLPAADEGSMSMMRSKLVNEEAMAECARRLGIDKMLKTADRTAVPTESMLADAMEAVIGAVYLDGGMERARDFVKEVLHETFLETVDGGDETWKDPKNRLQEMTQARRLPAPVYKLIGKKGKDHAPLFEVEVNAAGLKATGKGRSIKAAEREAAARLLEKLE